MRKEEKDNREKFKKMIVAKKLNVVNWKKTTPTKFDDFWKKENK